MEEVVLLESRVSKPSPVCFGCFGETEQEKELLLELQRNNKFVNLNLDSPEDIALRHVLQLCGSLAQSKRDYSRYPFVRAVSEELRLNLLFVGVEDISPRLYWESPVQKEFEFLMHLPFECQLTEVVLLAPTGGWNADDLEVKVFNRKKLCAFGQVGDEGQRLKLTMEGEGGGQREQPLSAAFKVVLSSKTSANFRVARLLLSTTKRVEEERLQQNSWSSGKDSPVSGGSLEEISGQGYEIFGKKSKRKQPVVNTKKPISVGHVEEQLRFYFPRLRVVTPLRQEQRGNVTEIWMVKQRNSILFNGGGLIVRVTKQEALVTQKMYRLQVRYLRVDDKGDLAQIDDGESFVIPVVTNFNVLLWFPLPVREQLSGFSFEFLDSSTRPQIWLTTCE
jgi:hypothetical protein